LGRPLDSPGWRGEPPEPFACPPLYDGVVWRRVVAYAIDLAVLAILLTAAWIALGVIGILSFGLLTPIMPIALALLPIAYHGLLVGGSRSATLGMRLLDIEVRSFTGGRPNLWQAVLMATLFYATISLTGSLILLAVLFNTRRRTVHDFLSGTVMVRTPAAALSVPSPHAL
jgi:uncharacterized RDD family membrane protein YckC